MPAHSDRRQRHSARLTLVDPKGLRNLRLTHPKLGLCNEVKTEQQEGRLSQGRVARADNHLRQAAGADRKRRGDLFPTRGRMAGEMDAGM
jgi:hypothetical protein